MCNKATVKVPRSIPEEYASVYPIAYWDDYEWILDIINGMITQTIP